jgi:hypothetical protein
MLGFKFDRPIRVKWEPWAFESPAAAEQYVFSRGAHFECIALFGFFAVVQGRMVI